MSKVSFPVWNVSISENQEDGTFSVDGLCDGLTAKSVGGGIILSEDEFDLFVILSPGQNLKYNILLVENYIDGGIDILASYLLPFKKGLSILSKQLNEYYNSSHNLSRKIWETEDEDEQDACRVGLKKLRKIFANPAIRKDMALSFIGETSDTIPTYNREHSMSYVCETRKKIEVPEEIEESHGDSGDGWESEEQYASRILTKAKAANQKFQVTKAPEDSEDLAIVIPACGWKLSKLPIGTGFSVHNEETCYTILAEATYSTSECNLIIVENSVGGTRVLVNQTVDTPIHAYIESWLNKKIGR